MVIYPYLAFLHSTSDEGLDGAAQFRLARRNHDESASGDRLIMATSHVPVQL